MSNGKLRAGQRKTARKVVAAVIEKDGRVLIAKRKKGQISGGHWEFPGGKIKTGERPEDGLRRELREELGVEAETGQFLGCYPFQTPEWAGELMVFKTQILSGKPRCFGHEEIVWAEPKDLDDYPFTEADRLMISAVFPNRRTTAKKDIEGP